LSGGSSVLLLTRRTLIHEFDAQETEKIHDEEREYLEDFEVFLEELQVGYTELGLSVSEYIERHCCARMKEHLSSRREPVNPYSLCCLLAEKGSDETGT
jgi:hypothetical protein